MSWSYETTDPFGDDWAELLSKSEHLLFHEGVWSEVLRQGISPRSVCVLFKENGVAKCGAIGFLLGGYGVNIGYFNYPYGGLIGTAPPASELESLLNLFAQEHRVCQLQLVGFPGAANFEGEGFEFQDDRTSVLDLSGETPESLWNGYRRSRRQDIRKTKERGITIEETSDPEHVELVHDFYLQTMQRTGGLARYRKSLLQAIVAKLGPVSRARMYLARKDDTPIAGMLIVDSLDMSHGLLLACSNEGLKHQPNKLLLHTAAESCTLKGISRLDYMPSGQSAAGVSNFKSLWGAEEVKLRHATLITMRFRSFLWRSAFAMAKRQPMRSLLTMLRRHS